MEDRRKWLDGRLYTIPVDSVINIQPTARFQCTAEKECSRTDLADTYLMEHDQGKCSALITREGFFDFLVCKTLCNVSHNAALVCQHNKRASRVFNNNMSDIKISFVDGFHSIQVFSSCERGWFMVDNICINFCPCHDCTDTTASRKQCQIQGGQLAYHLLNNVTISTPGNILDKDTKLSLFWNSLHHVDIINTTARFEFLTYESYYQYPSYQKHFDLNSSSLCIAFNLSNQCMDSEFVLAVAYHYFIIDKYGYMHQYRTHSSRPMWSVIYQPTFKIEQYKHYSLCEKPVVRAAILTNCSDLYMSCDEGTCIHD